MSRYEQFGANSIKDNNENSRPSLLGVYQAVVVLNQQDEEIKRLNEKIENIGICEDGIIYNCLVLITDGNFEDADREELAYKLNVKKEYIDYLMDYYYSCKFKSFEDYLDHKIDIDLDDFSDDGEEDE